MEKMKEFFNKNKKQIILCGVVSVIIILVVIAAVVLKGKAAIKEEETTQEVTTVEETTTTDPYANKERSYLTGKYISKKAAAKRPVAVMINNISDSMPQSGLGKAGVIYESPVEGGITRLMAMFDNYKGIKKIGSVRSCRIYYCYFALEWDAIYCHYGQSKYALDFLNSDKIDNVSATNSGFDYFKASDRSAPHNIFINEKGINTAVKRLGYRAKYKSSYEGRFNFADIDTQYELQDGTAAKTVDIAYPHNHPYFQYDKSTGEYLRFQFGGKHIDAETNKQLSCKNIVIQFVDSSIFPDGKSLNIILTGKGNGYYITNGKAIDIKWSKNEQLGVTKYTNAQTGEEITLNNGKTWFCIVQNSTDVSISE